MIDFQEKANLIKSTGDLLWPLQTVSAWRRFQASGKLTKKQGSPSLYRPQLFEAKKAIPNAHVQSNPIPAHDSVMSFFQPCVDVYPLGSEVIIPDSRGGAEIAEKSPRHQTLRPLRLRVRMKLLNLHGYN